MGNITKAEREARALAAGEKHHDEKHDDGLVEMEKDGEVTRVHPTCVKAHQAAGWKLKA